MDDATQKRHRENAAENVRRGFGRVAYLPSFETVDLIDALEAAQRPPVSPEQRYELVAAVTRVLHPSATRSLPMASDYASRIADAILARFSLPVLDVEKVADWIAHYAVRTNPYGLSIPITEAHETATALISALPTLTTEGES